MTHLIHKAYKYRLYPTKTQAEILDDTFAAHQFVYNKTLWLRQTSYQNTQPTLNRPIVTGQDQWGRDVWKRDDKGKVVYEEYVNPDYDENAKALSKFDCNKLLTQFKKTEEGAWLNDYEADAFGWTIDNVDQAYKNFFRRLKQNGKKGFPKYKNKKHPLKSYTSRGITLVKEGVTAKGKPKDVHTKLIDDNNKDDAWRWIYVPKIGNIKIRLHTPPLGTIRHATISKTSKGDYYVSFCCTNVPCNVFSPPNTEIGIDLGIRNQIIANDGTTYPNGKFTDKYAKQLCKQQRKLSRKTIGSNRWKKQQKRVAKIHSKIANSRNYATHQATHKIASENNLICVEDLCVKDMLSEHKIAKALSDVSLFEVVRQLEYKADWYGGHVQKVAREFPSTQQCCNCGELTGPKGFNELNIRKWTCTTCGCEHDTDVNAAINILDEGKKLYQAS